jgi:hypothetical protein
MAATAAQRSRLRRMCGLAADDATYDDDVLDDYIEAYPLLDENGEQPYTWSSATPPAQVVNTNWVATYDLNAAAADVWDEIAAGIYNHFDFSAEGRSFSKSQTYEHAQGRARYYRSRRQPTSMKGVQWPEETGAVDQTWIANLAEPND